MVVEYEAYTELDYKSRMPKPKYRQIKQLEDALLSINKENLKVYVIGSGVLYGNGEVAFANHFKAAWKQDPFNLPYIGEGANLIPTIHVKDLVKLITKISDNPPENKYIFGIDNSKDRTQKAIIEAISRGVGSGKVESVETSPIFEKKYLDYFNLDLDLVPSGLMVSASEENPVEFDWEYQVQHTISARPEQPRHHSPPASQYLFLARST